MAGKVLKSLEKTTKQVITNKYVLYVLLFLAILNVLAFLITNNFISLAVFALIGLLTSYFTKNMVVVLLVTLVVSSFLHISRKTVETMVNRKKKKNKKQKKEEKEGMDGSMTDDFEDAAPVPKKKSKHAGDKDEDKSHHGDDDTEDESDDEDDAPVMKNKKKGRVNQQETIKEAYNNIHSILGDEGLQNMTKDTGLLIKQQDKLVQSLENMAPIMQSASTLLEKLNLDSIGDMLGGMNFPGKKKNN